MHFKSLLSKIHLWVGLITFPLVFFICITGTVIVFADEVIELSAGKNRYVSEVKENRVPVESLLATLKEEYPNRRIPSYMVAYRNPERSVRFNSYDPEKGLRMIYVDPYTGEILKDDPTIHFFYTTAHLHNSFMWHGVGEWIVDISVILFLVFIVSGLIIWWPKTWDKKHKKAALSISTTTTRTRLNHDLHSVLGFYSIALSLILSITGLIIAFKPLAKATTNMLGGNAEAPWEKSFPAYDSTNTTNFPINDLISKTFDELPDKTELQIYTYFLRNKGYLPIKATNKVQLKSAKSLDYRVFNRYTGEKIPLSDEALLTEKIENIYWVLHMGSWGLLGKMVTFLGGLILSSLPVTGFLIWWHKYKKQKEAKERLSNI